MHVRNKLSYKLILYIFLISITLTALSLYINIQNTYSNQIKKFKMDLNRIETDRLEILSQSLWDVNQVAIKIFLNNLLHDDKIIYAKIIENDGNIYEVGKEKNDNVIKKVFLIKKKFKNEEYDIGQLILVADLNPLKQKLQKEAMHTIVFELIEILLISLLIAFIIKKFLTNNIEKMADYAQQMSLDNLNKPLHIRETNNPNEQNELDTVVDSINTMRLNLLQQIEKSREKDTILAHQSKMAAMGEMIGNIAHQWRQPLSVISTAATGIKVNKELGLFDEKYILDTMDSINESTQYLSTTIDDFRNFFKPEKEKKYFYIQAVIDKTFSLISQQFKNKEIEVILNIKDIKILGFENELIQVMINLLNNARDELIKLPSSQKRLIFIESFIQEKQLIIQIKDNAGGIQPKILDKIFEPYFTTKSKNLGTGIGLYMCEEIITKHMQGELTVENTTYTYEKHTYTGAVFIIKLKNIQI